MPLVPFAAMLAAALRGKYAVGYFEAWNWDSLEAILSAAEEADSPAILGFGAMTVNQAWCDAWGLEYFAALGRVAIAKSKVPACLILNETKTYDQCVRGLGLGFNVVMLDSSHLPFRENMEITGRLAAIAHARGVAVEAEVGRLPEAGGAAGGALTDPDEAAEFVRATQVDALAVSIGNVHLSTEREADVDLQRLRAIRERASVPLVLHGGSGFPQRLVRECVELGVAKFNVGTVLKKEYYLGIQSSVGSELDPSQVQRIVGSRDTTDFTYEAKRRVQQKVKQFLTLYGSAGRSRAGKLLS
jgi:ketose-bisphosphate aldolase